VRKRWVVQLALGEYSTVPLQNSLELSRVKNADIKTNNRQKIARDKRANAVVSLLVTQGIVRSNITVKGVFCPALGQQGEGKV